ncbi:MAG: peptidylprolyl isomerase [Rhizobiales bacterium]|nr:peptidylprolyl isomerase [Hyphomicrobiales bacterium]
MNRIARALFRTLLPGMLLSAAPLAAPAWAAERVHMEIDGDAAKVVVVELLADIAPNHVERVKTLVSEKFYDGVVFHRVMSGFMAQSGDRSGTGTQGSSYPDLKAEFTKTPFRRGTVGAARTANPNSANSQFFICFTDNGCAHLVGQYTVWGQVVSGMEHIDGVKTGAPGSGAVTNPSVISRMWLAE